MSKNSKNIIQNLSSKYSLKLIVHTKQSRDALTTTSKRVIQETVEAAGDLNCYITKVSKSFQRLRKYLKKGIYL